MSCPADAKLQDVQIRSIRWKADDCVLTWNDLGTFKGNITKGDRRLDLPSPRMPSSVRGGEQQQATLALRRGTGNP